MLKVDDQMYWLFLIIIGLILIIKWEKFNSDDEVKMHFLISQRSKDNKENTYLMWSTQLDTIICLKFSRTITIQEI